MIYSIIKTLIDLSSNKNKEEIFKYNNINKKFKSLKKAVKRQPLIHVEKLGHHNKMPDSVLLHIAHFCFQTDNLFGRFLKLLLRAL